MTSFVSIRVYSWFLLVSCASSLFFVENSLVTVPGRAPGDR